MDICKQIKTKTGLKITEYARSLGVSRQVFYASLQGNGSRAIRVEIALLLGKSPKEIFPYDEDDHKEALDMLEWEKAIK